MSHIVLDSSVLAKWILPEPDSPDALRLLRTTHANGDRCLCLDLALIEVANVIWTRFHRGMATISDVQTYTSELQRSPAQVERAGALLTPAMDIATRYRVAVYDALFVALADAMGLIGVTADVPLCKAVQTDFPRIVLLRDWSATNP